MQKSRDVLQKVHVSDINESTVNIPTDIKIIGAEALCGLDITGIAIPDCIQGMREA